MTTVDYDDALFEASYAKRFGKNALIDLEGVPSIGLPGTFIPTPAETLNLALGIGGLNKGAIVEIYGPESSGKTTLGTEILKQVQLLTNRPVAVLDPENCFDKDYAQSIGFNVSRLWCKFEQEPEAEEALNKVLFHCQSGMGAVLIDSIPALTPKAQLDDKDVTDTRVAGISKLLSDSLKRIKAVSSQTGTLVIFINQIRSKVGKDAMFGNPETRPGGYALKFFADCVMRTSATSTPEYLVDKSTGERLGISVIAEIKKLKWAAPFKKAAYDIIFGSGIDRLGSIVDSAISTGKIKQAGSWFSFHGKQLGQGRNGVRKVLESDPQLTQQIVDALWSKSDELQ